MCLPNEEGQLSAIRERPLELPSNVEGPFGTNTLILSKNPEKSNIFTKILEIIQIFVYKLIYTPILIYSIIYQKT